MQEIEAVQKSFPLHLRLVVIFRDFLIFQPLVFVDLGMIVTQKTAPECSTLYTVHTLVSFLKALLTSAISMKKHLERFIEASLCKENNLRKCFCIKKHISKCIENTVKYSSFFFVHLCAYRSAIYKSSD